MKQEYTYPKLQLQCYTINIQKKFKILKSRLKLYLCKLRNKEAGTFFANPTSEFWYYAFLYHPTCAAFLATANSETHLEHRQTHLKSSFFSDRP